MKSRSTLSVIAVLVLVAAVIMLITRYDFNHMDGDGWTIFLLIASVLFGFIALITKGNSSKIKKETEEEPSDELKLKHTELKLQELHKNGILTEEEYQKKLTEARMKMGGYKMTVDNLKALFNAGLLSQEEFDQKAGEAYERNKSTPFPESLDSSNSPTDTVARLMELREADLITQEEFEEQMNKI